MSDNKIGLKSISELLGMNFFIPSYQRGYRWDKQQVEDLLNDIYSFAIKKKESEKEFYCLQPIVVRKISEDDEVEKKLNNLHSELDNNEWYEVIDGQQRLTTIKILISYLVKELYSGKSLYETHKKHPFEIEYETRKDSRSFLNNIDFSKSNEDIDFYYISEAYDTITKWFNSSNIEDPQQAKETIRNTILYGVKNQRQEGIVQIIWYEINDSNISPIDTFIRINMGKIPLTNAELIKALFLQERNFGTNEDIAKLRQIEIANEWDKMEYSLQNEDFWWFLNKGKNDIPARIEFLFEIIYNLERPIEEKDKQKFDNQFGTDKYKIFRYFNVLFADKNITFEKIEKEWNNIKDYYSAFEEWFNRPIWYHYIGFLISSGVSVIDIYKIYKDKKKDEFETELINEIKKRLDVKYLKIIDENEKENFKIDLSYDNKSKEKIRQLFLLFNIEFIVKQYHKMMIENDNKEDDLFIMKFPFKIFKNENWDIEHIDSFTTNPINDKNTAIEWLESAEVDFEDEITDELKNRIYSFKKGTDNFKDFSLLQDDIKKIADEDDNDEMIKNSIGNLTLLNIGTNRSYGNSLFRTKRRIIIEKEKEGTFIPICTKYVFLKYFDKKGTSRTKWTYENDIPNYENHIVEYLKGANDKFITFKANSNE